MSDALLPDLSPFEVKVSTDPEVTIRGRHGGTGPALLLLHGFPQTHVIWHKVAPTLSKHFTLVLPDLRGYGSSSKPSSKDATSHALYSKEAMAGDMASLMTHLGHSHYYVVGHDRGGRVAHKLILENPDVVRKAMLLDIAPTLAMLEAADRELATAYWHWFFLTQPAPFPEDSIVAAPDVFAKKTLRGLPKGKDGREIFSPAAFEEYRKYFSDPETVHGWCEDYRAAAKEDCEDQRATIQGGRKIKVPLRVLWGSAGLVEKKFDAVKEWDALCEEGFLDRRSRAVDSGHYIPEEIPDELIQDILEFFK